MTKSDKNGKNLWWSYWVYSALFTGLIFWMKIVGIFEFSSKGFILLLWIAPIHYFLLGLQKLWLPKPDEYQKQLHLDAIQSSIVFAQAATLAIVLVAMKDPDAQARREWAAFCYGIIFGLSLTSLGATLFVLWRSRKWI